MGMYDARTEAEIKASESNDSAFKNIVSRIFDKLQVVIILLALLVVLYLVLITPHEVDGRSMDPTYKDGEYLVANKLVYKLSKPKHGDVIIFKKTPTQDYIKRVIGVPGDTVSLRDGALYLNGEMLDEGEYLDGVITNGGSFLQEGRTITVPEGEYFVSGDNRPHSSDSRAFGTIEEDVIKGRVWFVIYPFDGFRIISRPNYE